MRIAICDDEQKAIETIRKKLMILEFPGLDISSYTSSSDLKKAYKNGERFEFIYLDIDMPEYNGIDIAKFINETDPNALIYYITGKAEYLTRTYQTRPFTLILKAQLDVEFDREFYRGVKSLNDRVYTLDKETKAVIKFTDIVYIEAVDHKTVVHDKTHKKYTVNNSLSSEQKNLTENFMQCHRNYIVNLAYISKLEDKTVHLTEDYGEIPLSRRHRQNLRDTFIKYVENGATP